MTRVRFCDEFAHGFGWIVEEFRMRTSHALLVEGAVWLIDPVAWDESERRAEQAGEVRGVIQLLSRHDRDCAAVASRFAVPHHLLRAPEPFTTIRLIDNPLWREVALWWPEARVLVVGDALGTVPGYFTAHGESLAVHPLRRLTPPRPLGGLDPDHVLCGHGEGIHGEGARPALDEALRTARRRLPRAWVAGLRRTLRL